MPRRRSRSCRSTSPTLRSGENIGARLQADQAEADTRVARAKGRGAAERCHRPRAGDEGRHCRKPGPRAPGRGACAQEHRRGLPGRPHGQRRATGRPDLKQESQWREPWGSRRTRKPNGVSRGDLPDAPDCRRPGPGPRIPWRWGNRPNPDGRSGRYERREERLAVRMTVGRKSKIRLRDAHGKGECPWRCDNCGSTANQI